ncbi:30S ribosomal protein S20 [Candidatus Bipolaricaulota bacterium]|nr:30S ribosomal protein S20 [Candidatus Bipolaricaulota bacterium]TFH09118.1 MAG: 30S ribosomal protein S20 [Candidatus Atribacteria bacterium]
MDEVIQIPHIDSAKKRLRQNVKRRGLNRSKRAEIRKVLKQIRLLLEANDKQAATALLPALAKAVDKAAKRNTIHPNKAARIKSRWTQRIQAA